MPKALLLAATREGAGEALQAELARSQPALLPWLPGRAFALKGAETGLATGAALWWGGRDKLA
jgi:hypothetical protein